MRWPNTPLVHPFRAAFLAVAARGSCNVSSLVAAPQWPCRVFQPTAMRNAFWPSKFASRISVVPKKWWSTSGLVSGRYLEDVVKHMRQNMRHCDSHTCFKNPLVEVQRWLVIYFRYSLFYVYIWHMRMFWIDGPPQWARNFEVQLARVVHRFRVIRILSAGSTIWLWWRDVGRKQMAIPTPCAWKQIQEVESFGKK